MGLGLFTFPSSVIQWELEYRTSPDFEDGLLERTGHLDTEQLEYRTNTTGLHRKAERPLVHSFTGPEFEILAAIFFFFLEIRTGIRRAEGRSDK